MKSDNKSTQDKQSKRRQTYSPPRVLSSEQLEAAAVTCSPPAGGFGKPGTQGCLPGQVGS